jgi:hypothetical protein
MASDHRRRQRRSAGAQASLVYVQAVATPIRQYTEATSAETETASRAVNASTIRLRAAVTNSSQQPIYDITTTWNTSNGSIGTASPSPTSCRATRASSSHHGPATTASAAWPSRQTSAMLRESSGESLTAATSPSSAGSKATTSSCNAVPSGRRTRAATHGSRRPSSRQRPQTRAQP